MTARIVRRRSSRSRRAGPSARHRRRRSEWFSPRSPARTVVPARGRDRDPYSVHATRQRRRQVDDAAAIERELGAFDLEFTKFFAHRLHRVFAFVGEEPTDFFAEGFGYEPALVFDRRPNT